MTVRPGFLQKTGLAEEKICSGPVLHRKSTILTGKMKKNGSNKENPLWDPFYNCFVDCLR